MSSILFPRQDGGEREAGGGLEDFEYYHYNPSMAAAIIFIIVFAATTAMHGYQMFRTKTWFLVPFFIGGLCKSRPQTFILQTPLLRHPILTHLSLPVEVIGYIGRAISANETPGEWTLGPYIIQTLFILLAPALFAASVYMCLGRIVLMIQGEKCLFIRRTWLTKIFVGGDVLSFLMQSAGGGLMSGGDPDSQDMGQNIVVGGLCVQIVFFGMFVVTSMIFHLRVRQRGAPLAAERPWQKHMLSLYLVSILIFVRCIIRVVEYIQGFDGYLMTREAFIYVFDALLMAVSPSIRVLVLQATC